MLVISAKQHNYVVNFGNSTLYQPAVNPVVRSPLILVRSVFLGALLFGHWKPIDEHGGHRGRSPPSEKREQSLASTAAAHCRADYYCIDVPAPAGSRMINSSLHVERLFNDARKAVECILKPCAVETAPAVPARHRDWPARRGGIHRWRRGHANSSPRCGLRSSASPSKKYWPDASSRAMRSHGRSPLVCPMWIS